MEIGILVALIAIICAIVKEITDRKPAIEAVSAHEPLCFTCAFAHIARGFREHDVIVACTFGGIVRPLKFEVCDCTLYCNRNSGSNLVRVIGFADTISDDDYIEVAARTHN